MRPDFWRYSVTTLEPGARLVFTYGFTFTPRATALRARSPAPSITEGFEVFVRLVMAAMTTDPWPISAVSPRIFTLAVRGSSSAERPKPRSLTGATNAWRKASFMRERATRSWGRFGPARLGSTVARSSDRLSVNVGSG